LEEGSWDDIGKHYLFFLNINLHKLIFPFFQHQFHGTQVLSQTWGIVGTPTLSYLISPDLDQQQPLIFLSHLLLTFF
jgi:hypothetical protein